MKKVFWIIIIIVLVLGGYFYFKKDVIKTGSGVTKTYTSIDQLTDSDKFEIAEAIIKGEEIISSGNTTKMRQILKITKPEDVDSIPDEMLKIVFGFSSGGILKNKEQMLSPSVKWQIDNDKNNVVYISLPVPQKSGSYTMLSAINIKGVWYIYN